MIRILAPILMLPALSQAGVPSVTAIRSPGGGVQPQAAVDASGKVHLVYLAGEDGKNDVFYTTSTDAGKTWATALRVNSNPGSAIATGTVRGAHLAVGRNGRAHVAWMGSQSAEPRGPGGATPMLYARLNDRGDTFEPQWNVIRVAPGLDGGGSIAADDKGNVVIAWHAPVPGKKGEENRTVWVTSSPDDGQTFTPERRLSDDPTGACGCCGMRVTLDRNGDLLALYRAANPTTRDVYLLHGGRGADNTFRATRVHEWKVKTCPMSTMTFAAGAQRGTVAAWETAGQVYFASWDSDARTLAGPTAPPGKGVTRKHPSVAVNKDGQTLLAWAEGTGWRKGGSLAWQVFDNSAKPVESATGGAKDLPVWSLPTAVPTSDGAFLVVY
jgi:hypothetical protein